MTIRQAPTWGQSDVDACSFTSLPEGKQLAKRQFAKGHLTRNGRSERLADVFWEHSP